MNNKEEFDFNIIKTNIRNGFYHIIGSGSGRRVYDLGNGYVVKYAKNNKGIAQNKAEYQIASTDNTNLFAKIPKVSDDYIFLIMEKADKLINFKDVWKYYNVRSNRELFQAKEINYIFQKYSLIRNDLVRLANWGIINGRPVIIDYGFTWKVKRQYYMPF